MKQRNIKFLLALLVSMLGSEASAHDLAVRNGDGKTIYLWGTENSYTPIYFPYIGSYCPKKWNSINRQGVYNLRILKGEAFDSNGRPIKPQAQENGESFENAEFINIAPTDENGNDNVDDWEDPNPYNVTI